MELIDAFSALRQRYDRYLDDYEQTVRGQSSIRGLEKLLRGKPSRQEEQAILDFYREGVARVVPRPTHLSAGQLDAFVASCARELPECCGFLADEIKVRGL